MKRQAGSRKVVLMVFLLSLTILFSCVEDDVKVIQRLDSYNINYTLRLGFVYPNDGQPPIVKIEFDSLGRIKKRVGGTFSTFIGETFFTEIFEEIKYDLASATLEQKESFEDFGLYPRYKKVVYKGGRIHVAVLSYLEGSVFQDTIFYFYKNRALTKTIQRSSFFSHDSKYYHAFENVKQFYYDSQNLVRIEGRKETYSGVITTTVELFEEYDNAPNPVKALGIFDDLFYRSLSKNNFSKYSYQMKDVNGVIQESANRSWTLNYDEKGIPTFK